jgi:hypothetical protein
VLGAHGLPLPADPAALPGIVLDNPPPQLLEYARPSPPLETLVGRRLRRPRTNRDGEPFIGILSTARTYLGVGDRSLGGSGPAAFGAFSLPSGKGNNERITHADGALQAPRQTKLLLASATKLLRPRLQGFWDRKPAGGVDQGSRWKRT